MRYFSSTGAMITTVSLVFITSGAAFADERSAREHRQRAEEESEIVAPNNPETDTGDTTHFDEADAIFGSRTGLAQESNIVVPNNRTPDEGLQARRGRVDFGTISDGSSNTIGVRERRSTEEAREADEIPNNETVRARRGNAPIQEPTSEDEEGEEEPADNQRVRDRRR